MCDSKEYKEVKNFFELFYDQVDIKYNEGNFYSIQQDLRFLIEVINNINIQPKNITHSNISNYVGNGNYYNWKTDYSLLKVNSNIIALFFCNPIAYEIFKEIKKNLSTCDYIIEHDAFLSNFKYDEYHDTIYDYHQGKNFLCLINTFYKKSINDLLLKIYKTYNSNYEKFIVQKNYYEILRNECNNILCKHNVHQQLIGSFYNISLIKKGEEFSPEHYHNIIIFFWNSHSHAFYKELYDLLLLHYKLLEDNVKLEKKYGDDMTLTLDSKNTKFKELQNLGKKIKNEIPELYCGPVMSSLASLLTKEYGSSENVEKIIDKEKDKIKKLFYDCAEEQKKKAKNTKLDKTNENFENTPSKNKKAIIPKKIKQLVWNKHIGEKNGTGLCMCCKSTTISQMDFNCGHIISEFNGGTLTINNLVPICSLCNSSMGTKNMNDFITKHKLGDIIKFD